LISRKIIQAKPSKEPKKEEVQGFKVVSEFNWKSNHDDIIINLIINKIQINRINLSNIIY